MEASRTTNREVMSKYLITCVFIVRIILGLLFLVAGTLKLFAPENFFHAIQSYAIVFDSTAELIARSLPVLEILLGIGLLSGVFIGACALGTATLTLIFTILSFQGWYRGLDLDCGCFGVATFALSPALLTARSFMIFILASGLYVFLATGFSKTQEIITNE